jgi:hypothetical protein
MLKGAAKTAYMHEYMWRRRAAWQAAAATIDALRKELAAAKARIRELEARGKQPETCSSNVFAIPATMGERP